MADKPSAEVLKERLDKLKYSAEVGLNNTAESLQERLSKLGSVEPGLYPDSAVPAGPVFDFSKKESVGVGVGDKVLDHVAAAPGALLQTPGALLAGVPAAIQTVSGIDQAETVTPEDSFLARLSKNYDAEAQLNPAAALMAPGQAMVRKAWTGEEMLAGLDAAAESNRMRSVDGVDGVPLPLYDFFTEEFKEAFPKHLDYYQEAVAQSAEQNPISHGLGEVGADTVAVMAFRKGHAKRNATAREKERVTEAMLAAKRKDLEDKGIVPPDPSLVKQFIDWPLTKGSLKRLGWGSEAAVEGALLSALSGDDPGAGMALAFGQQLAGRTLHDVNPATAKSMKGFAAKIGTLFVVYRLSQDIVPGGGDPNSFEALDFTMDRTTALMGLGALGVLSGAGRTGPGTLTSKLGMEGVAKQFPGFIDSLTTYPRVGTQKFIRDMALNNDPQASIILGAMAQKPEDFDVHYRRRLERAFDGKAKKGVSATLIDFQKDRRFMRKLNSVLDAHPELSEEFGILEQGQRPSAVKVQPNMTTGGVIYR